MGTDAFEAAEEADLTTSSIVFDLAGLGISLINSKLVEVIYLSLSGFKLDYSTTASSRSLAWTVESIQIDNQLTDAVYPIVLQPTPIAESVKRNGVPPCIQLSVMLLNDQRKCCDRV
jgi:vacuolar protein sorting-associated protein 13A/C